MTSSSVKDIPKISLKAFRVIAKDFPALERKPLYKALWNLSGVVLNLNVRRMDEIGENFLASELRDAFISIYEVSHFSHVRFDITTSSISHLDGFTIDTSSDESIKRSMRLLSGRLAGRVNWEISGRKRRWEEPDKLHTPGVYPTGPRKSIEEIAIIYRSKRRDVWRMMLAVWQIGHVNSQWEVGEKK